MIVEFCGLSGVGKTTLASAVCDDLAASGHPFIRVGPKTPFGGELSTSGQWMRAGLSLIRRPLVLTKLGVHLLSSIAGDDLANADFRIRSRLFVKWWRRLAIYLLTVNDLKASGKVCIFERGLHTNLFSILLRLKGEHISSVYECLSKAGAASDLIILVEADFCTIKSRRLKRGDSEKAWMVHSVADEERKLAAINEAAMMRADRGYGRVVSVCAEVDNRVEINANRVIEVIEEECERSHRLLSSCNSDKRHNRPVRILIYLFVFCVNSVRRSRNFPGLPYLRRWYRHYLADVYILSFPKSGRSWLRFLIGRTLIQHHGGDVSAIPKTHHLHRLDPRLPRIFVTHDDFPHRKRPEELEIDKTRYGSKKVILLVRDPRDVIVSLFFHRKYRGKGTEFAVDELSDFVRQECGGIDSIIAFYNVWAKNLDVPKELLLVRYEDLRRDTFNELKRILLFLGITWISDDTLIEAIKFSSFENMKKMESENPYPFTFGSWNKRNLNNPESFKVRRGKIGGFKDYLTEKDLAFINGEISENLANFFESYR